MSKKSAIPHKRPITLSANRELIAKAQEKGLNISLILDAALEKELNPSSQKAYINAVTTKLYNIEEWMKKNKLEQAYYEDKFTGGEKNVFQKEERSRQTDIRQALADIETN